MKNSVRVLLLILTILFVATALFIKSSVSENQILQINVDKVSKSLHEKETLIDNALSDSLISRTFEYSDRYPLQLKEISKKYEDKNIFFYIFHNNNLRFWSSNIYVPKNLSDIRVGSALLEGDNFSFVSKRKNISESLSVVALIPIQRNFDIDYKPSFKYNFYGVLNKNNLQLAKLQDTDNVKNIYNNKKEYLFSVKPIDNNLSESYSIIQLICIVSGIVCLLILINNLSFGLAKKGYPIISIAIFALALLLIRVIDIESTWLPNNFNIKLFQTSEVPTNYFYPNLWAYLANSVSLLWLISYTIYIRDLIKISRTLKSTLIGPAIYYIVLSGLYIFIFYLFHSLTTQVTGSAEQEEFIQLLYTNTYSIIHMIIYLINVIILLLLLSIVVTTGKRLCPNITWNINTQLIVLLQFLIISAIVDEFNFIYIFIAILILAKSFDNTILKNKQTSINLVTLICIALMTSMQYAESSKTSQIEQMKLMLTKLETDEDSHAISLFSTLENSLANDNQLQEVVKTALVKNTPFIINEYIQKKYITGYLSIYNFSGYYFYNNRPLEDYRRDIAKEYREKVIKEASKVAGTKRFYKAKSEYGQYDYFSIISTPILNEEFIFILNLQRNTKASSYNIPFFSKLYSAYDGKSINLRDNNFAIYKNGALANQNGNFTYPDIDLNSKQPINKFIELDDYDGFYHLIYRPDTQTTLLASKKYDSAWQFLTVTSITFLFIYIATNIISFLIKTVPKIIRSEIKLRYITVYIRFALSRIGYSTRIQSLVISSVLIAIIITGVISFYSLKVQAGKRVKTERLNYISSVVNNIEKNIVTDSLINPTNELTKVIQEIAKVSVTDFNLYDRNGKMLYSTQANIYNHRLFSSYINPDAYIDLNVFKKNETDIKENLLDFKYEATYAPIKNENLNTIAYLSIPYFNSTEIETNYTLALLKTILNIYTVITIVFAFLSIYISSKVTEPLQIIRKSLSQVNLTGKNNNPLFWDKNDEIGLLVKEYNQMLVKLEDNAKQLRNAERENVWREMAKQVAHEVKNPLTPMKLGIQQLMRSFKENDPKLEQRFDKITTSFIEQIDALSHIAEEFSSFAKLPESYFVPINIFEKINKSVDVYNNSNNTEITVLDKTQSDNILIFADKAQLLRTFNNLIKNSIEGSKGRRKIRIQIIVEYIDHNTISVSVEDNGYGIPSDVVDKIFKPNFTTKSSGTGLGLAFVKQTITAIGGEIDFTTEIGRGTTFIMKLPIYKG